MYLLQCDGCRASTVVSCTCPPGSREHVPGCALTDIGANLACVPGAGCCAEDHSHDEAANACPGGHEGQKCPDPGTCGVTEGDGCAGGHCGKGVPGCTVCRPITIAMLPGSARASLARKVN